MEKLKQKKDYFLWFCILCLAVSTVLIIVAIFRGTPETFHSDDAIAVLLAREQLESGKLIPPMWDYAYEYWILSLNLFVLPFLKITGQMLLSRELAVIVQLLCLEGVFYWFMSKMVEKKWAVMGCVLLIAPLSFLQMEHFYFQATYATSVMWSFVILVLTYLFYESESRKKIILSGVILCILIIALGCGGTRTLGTVILPLLGGIVLVALMEAEFSLWPVLKNRQLVVKTCIICAAALAGIVAGNALLKLGQTQGTQGMYISESTDFFHNLSALITSYFQVYGCFDAETLMSGSGILGFLKLVYAVAAGIVVPVVLLVRFPKLTKWQRIYVVYSMLAAGVIAYMMVFCGLTNSYYLLPAYANNIGLICVFAEHFKEKLHRVLMWLTICFALPVAVLSCFFWAKYHYETVDRWAYFQTVDSGLLAFLEEEGLEYGYSDFFNAQAYTVALNGRVEIVSVNEEYMWSEEEGRMMAVVRQPAHARAWLSSKRYEESYHSGESFVLTRTEFLDELKPQYRERAERVLNYNEYTILVYPHSMAYYRQE